VRTPEAEVHLHGRRVGLLRFKKGRAEFTYEDALDSPDHRTLGQIFEDDPRAARRSVGAVPAWFANLLPEGALRKRIVQEFGGGNVNDYTLLVKLGTDLPGAVTVHGDEAPDEQVPEPSGGLPDHPLRHSLAGVQLKFSVSADRITSRVSGVGGWWIVKLPDRSVRDLPTNEYLTMRWLAAAGFDVPHVDLVAAKNISGISEGLANPDELLYIIERFDRTPAGRVHVEDFAQVADLEPTFKYGTGHSYDGLAAVVARLCGREGYEDFTQRLAAMIITGNTDAHLKNWAFRYADGRTPSLTPVYDFHSLSVYSQYQYETLALGLLGEKVRPVHVTLDEFRRMAERIGQDPESTALIVVETVERMRAAWAGGLLEEAHGRFEPLARHYSERLRSLPIARG
jgi:serine/threonine-protein kinase HipA